MSHENNLQLMTVDALAQSCAEETENFRMRLHDDSRSWGNDPALAPEETMIDLEKRHAFWVWINDRLHDDKERLVVYGSYDLDLKPKELYDRFRNMFDSVAEIYTIKQNILARLQRDPDRQTFFGKDA